MRTITPSELEDVIESIIEDKAKVSNVIGQKFAGVIGNDMASELQRRLGDFAVKKNDFHLTKADIGYVANGRFYHRIGQNLLLFLAVVILLVNLFTDKIQVLPVYVGWAILMILGGGIIFTYFKKQRASRKELESEVYGKNES
jgi:hypothetical protein